MPAPQHLLRRATANALAAIAVLATCVGAAVVGTTVVAASAILGTATRVCVRLVQRVCAVRLLIRLRAVERRHCMSCVRGA